MAVQAQNVTVNIKNQRAESAFATIMQQTGKNFVYSADLLKGLKVSVTANNEPLKSVLNRMFANTPVTYKIKGKNVVLMARPVEKVAETKTIKSYSISGFVREEGTQEAIVGAVVKDKYTGYSTFTNANGFYSLTLPQGKAFLEVEFSGYDPYITGDFPLTANKQIDIHLTESKLLDEVVVIESRNRRIAMQSADMGAFNLSQDEIKKTPVIFGEPDVVKSLQLQPGVSAGIEGFAGMYVHGGNADENLYMLDNIPLYQVNHFAGLFSAFNVDALRNVDFYKSSFPAKYDGRLSSFMDVHTKDGSLESHHGSAKLGLTSGAFNINGPISKGRTSYSLALRRSWYDILTIPTFAIINATVADDDKFSLGYAFMDINAKINHRFNDRSSGYVMFYYGDDYLRGSSEDGTTMEYWYEKDKTNLHWGNVVASAGWKYIFSPKIYGEVTGAFSRYYSSMKTDMYEEIISDNVVTNTARDIKQIKNNINDVILRADFDWRPTTAHRVNFGIGYTRHNFLPSKLYKSTQVDNYFSEYSDDALTYNANEANAYIGDDWNINAKLRANIGLHYSMFEIDSKRNSGLSPRFSLRYAPIPTLALKAGYSRAYQYVHQLFSSNISLPTDQWVPITKDFKPQNSDKVSLGAYYTLNNEYTFSVEGYYKWMRNLVDYRDEYYLYPGKVWDSRLTTGKGTSKGIDFKVSKELGAFTGHLAYSLLWADRTFAEKNGGVTYPARFDNRHKINVVLNYRINDKWEINAAWTGMSGNRFTFSTYSWSDPEFTFNGDNSYYYFTEDTNMYQGINNYRLPFYHRLDLGFTRYNKHGYWNFSLYNAYCNMNTIAYRQGWNEKQGRPIYQKLHLLPIIPSVSYTWIF
jgi:hypothetical protein